MKPYLQDQAVAINKLKKYKVGALFMEAGTGKTRIVVDLINSIVPDYVLYIAPYRGINAINYEESIVYQVNLWGGIKSRHDFIGVESIGCSDRIYLDVHNKLSISSKAVIVVDESLKIKNSDAKRTKRVLNLAKLVDYKLILNGTPISRNLLDLWSQMEFLSPKILGMGESQFKNTFCEYKKVTITKSGTFKSRSKEWIVKYHNLDYLYSLIEPFVFFSDLKIDVGVQFIEVKYELSDEEKAEHQRIKDKILDNEWLMMKPNFFLEITQKLQNNYSRSENKFNMLRNILKNDPNCLIVAKFVNTQLEIKKRFPKARVLSWQKDSLALNLQSYSKMVLFDKHFDYALFDQIIHRILRTGQDKECIVYRLTGNVGLENMMDNNIDRKGDMLSEFKKLSLNEFKKLA